MLVALWVANALLFFLIETYAKGNETWKQQQQDEEGDWEGRRRSRRVRKGEHYKEAERI